MILHMGIRTTEPMEVVYKSLEPDEEEAPAISELLIVIAGQNPYGYDKYDHSIVVHYDPPGTPDRRRELMIPVFAPTSIFETKTFPSVRAAFLVFKDTDTTMEEYYDLLRRYISESNLKVSDDIHSIEIMYVPEDLDEQDYTIEIMIPLVD